MDRDEDRILQCLPRGLYIKSMTLCIEWFIISVAGSKVLSLLMIWHIYNHIILAVSSFYGFHTYIRPWSPKIVINTRKVHIKSFNLATKITPAQKWKLASDSCHGLNETNRKCRQTTPIPQIASITMNVQTLRFLQETEPVPLLPISILLWSGPLQAAIHVLQYRIVVNTSVWFLSMHKSDRITFRCRIVHLFINIFHSMYIQSNFYAYN